MYYDIIEAKHIGDYKVEISFKDGKNGVIDLKNYIKKGGIFSRLSDFNYFMQFYIDRDLYVLSWPNGLDVAPETIYSSIEMINRDSDRFLD
ncbi:MAG: DUF2442 domain-containing protein [bacterium]